MYKLKGKFKLSEMTDKTRIPSHHHMFEKDGFVYYFVNVRTKRIIKPGLYTIRPSGFGDAKLIKTTFSKAPYFNDNDLIVSIVSKMDKFFSKLHIYLKHKIEVPKRSILLYGPSGGGKTSLIQEACKDYIKDNKTAVILWGTNSVDADRVKDLLQELTYVNVERLIFVLEDLGGVETPERSVESDATLLSLLDNKEKTFKVATLVISTTNYPEMLFENLANRPGRFDHKIEVGHPKGEDRVKLLRFLSDNTVPEPFLEQIVYKEYDQLTPAHLNEIMFRVELYDITYDESLAQIMGEIKDFKSMYKKPKKVGI